MAGDGEAHRLQGRNGLAVGRVSLPGVVQLIDSVQLLCGEWLCRGILHNHRLGVGLDDLPAPEGVLLAIVQGKGPGVLPSVPANSFKAGNYQAVISLRRLCHPAPPEGHRLLDSCARNIPDLANLLSPLQPPGDLPDGPLSHAVDDHIRRGIGQDGAADGVRPVVVMGKAPQAGFDPPQDEWNAGKEAVHPVGVDNGRPVRAQEGSARRVDVALPPLEAGREAIDHGVDVTGGDAEEEAGAAQALEVLRLPPVWLGDYPQAVAGIPEHPAHDCSRKAGMVHVGVTADEDHVELIYAQLFALSQGHGEKWGLHHLHSKGRAEIKAFVRFVPLWLSVEK